MAKFIKIETTQFGIDLFETTAKSIEHHSTQLKQRMAWLKFINGIEPAATAMGIKLPFDEYRFVLDYDAMVNISILDLALLVRQFYIAQHHWEKLYFSKQGYALIYETISKINQYNRNLYTSLSDRSATGLNQYKLIIDRIKLYKVTYDYEGIIKEVRNKVASHIEDFKVYYSIINSIDTNKSLLVMTEFVHILNALEGTITILLTCFQSDLAKHASLNSGFEEPL